MNVKKLFIAVLFDRHAGYCITAAQPTATQAPARPFRIAVIIGQRHHRPGLQPVDVQRS